MKKYTTTFTIDLSLVATSENNIKTLIEDAIKYLKDYGFENIKQVNTMIKEN